jgi:hypothetical protein
VQDLFHCLCDIVCIYSQVDESCDCCRRRVLNINAYQSENDGLLIFSVVLASEICISVYDFQVKSKES